ncbi:Lrp/AsnC family transcriptional regulator [Arthrobacter rhombi]|uniref:Lrp/AsnC family transcriptional regulator n=1 Tax=Arthrobacter rhombi TaxID=71253 RepID=UPI0031DFF1A3
MPNSDEDARLIHALQLAPRAPWSELSRVLSVSPTALAQRYARLRDSGLVRITGHPTWIETRHNAAFAEIDVEPGSLAAATAILTGVPMALTLDATASGTLIVSITVPDDLELAALLTDGLPSLPGVREVRAHLVTSRLKSGERWNLRALEPEQAARIGGHRPPRARAARGLDRRSAAPSSRRWGATVAGRRRNWPANSGSANSGSMMPSRCS